jgi:beta-mannosidase
MHRDLWPAAGWGIVDSTGLAKAAYWYLARACAPVALLLTDEGVNGLALHAVNDGPTSVDGELTVKLWKGKTPVAEGTQPVTMSPRSASTHSADAILGSFTDVSYAYRFGPPGHDIVVATLRDRATGTPISESFYFPNELRTLPTDPGMTAEAVQAAERDWIVTVRCDSAAIAVAVDLDGFVPSDSYFHMAPSSTKRIRLRSVSNASAPSGSLFALNADQPTRVIVRSDNDAQRPSTDP